MKEEIPTVQQILDNEDMRALAAVGAMSLGRLDLCIALMKNTIKILNVEENRTTARSSE